MDYLRIILPERVVFKSDIVWIFVRKSEYMQVLNEKETVIARYAAEGMTTTEMAEVMCLSPETIRWYRKRMLRKTGAKNITVLIAMLKDENIL